MNDDRRQHRCPDGGYCHGSTLAAGSAPCLPGRCLRVSTSGPLSGVFPGDRWPDELTRRPEGETHDDRCCMNGVPAGSDPHPDCPGVEALQLDRVRPPFGGATAEFVIIDEVAELFREPQTDEERKDLARIIRLGRKIDVTTFRPKGKLPPS